MFGRPRCREWTPLATQQLRLRSLIQIVGYNIRPPEGCISPCSYYITLHHTTMSAPFYMSERISSPHPKWKEIDSEITQGMSSTNVVIRVWCRLFQSKESDVEERPQDAVIQTWGIYFSGMRYIGANLASNFTSDCFKSNTLVFQMHGGYFCSYKSLKLDIIPAENEIEQGSLSSDSSGKTNLSKIVLESKFIKSHKHLKESRSVSPSKFAKKSEKEYSKSQSPVERGFKQNFPKLKPSASFVIQNSKDRNKGTNSDRVDPSHIYEHSPDSLDVKEFYEGQRSKDLSVEDLSASKIDLSETAENYDLRSEAGVPKYRYQSLSFLKSEIRPSYNATKLQKLHLLQYSIKKKQEAVQEIKERIYKNSAVSDSLLNEDDRSKSRSRSQRNLFSADDEGLDVDKSLQDLRNGKVKDAKPAYNGPRLTLKLNDLLSFKAKPSPLQRAEHVRLTKQMEILRFKRIILSDERDSKLANIRRLKEKHAKLLEANQDLGLELFESYHVLSRDKEALPERVARVRCLREAMGRAKVALANRRDILLADLAELMNIKQKDETTWTICDVPLPICSDEGPRPASAVSDAVAAGLAAQAAVLAASVLSQPLRYQVTLLGSATKILDITPDLPDPNIPLFARGGDVSLFRYGMFLLNKSIAQLAWSRGRRVADMRPTLANLARLTAPPVRPDSTKMFDTCRWLDDNQCPRTQSLRSLVVSERGKYRQFNRFKSTPSFILEKNYLNNRLAFTHPPNLEQDSVDGQPPHAMHIRTHRLTRSVGSYTDDKEMQALDTSTTSVMGSESNIYDMKLAKASSSDMADYKKTHNSDSELSRLADDSSANESVTFIVGDDGNDTQLVRLSTNNGDAATKDFNEMQRILCTEIEDFCTTNSRHDYKDIHEGFDVAKHMDAVKNMDIANHMKNSAEIESGVELSCDTCVNNMDEVCDISCATNITDVILIPSAEVLDTGQVCADIKEA